MVCDAVTDNYNAMCPEPPCGNLNVTDPNTLSLILAVFNDAMQIFDDDYFHLGGDEVKETCWLVNKLG